MSLEPRWWQAESDGRAARCGLCFHHCRIPLGGMGYCGARGFGDAGFASPYLGRFSSCAVDPVEKKPLHHWMPGTFIFSLGSVGCNMRCPFCQNHGIAQPKTRVPLMELSPQALTARVLEHKLSSVAFTYNEPTLQAEYILEAAPLLKEAGIAVALVTNGMIAREPLDELLPWISAANVDVKTFNKAAYSSMGGSLETVRDTVAHMVRAGVHVELTTLVVPGISDSPEEFVGMIDWIAGLSPDIPLHLSRYFPAHKYTEPATSVPLLQRLQGLAREKLRHAHLGNVR